tara:strand:- start:2277 stop:2567 length:291 start_codon:yes stop_codon:yes gene_type:complete
MASRDPNSKAQQKNEKFLLNRLAKMYGEDFDPIMQIAKNAHRLQKLADSDDTDAGTQLDANKEWERMAQFTHPKLKSVEHIGDGGMFEVHVHRGKD